jgi:hypothetical protein
VSITPNSNKIVREGRAFAAGRLRLTPQTNFKSILTKTLCQNSSDFLWQIMIELISN